MENKFTCEHCSKTFKSKKTLTFHKNSTTYCLKIQNKPIEKTCEHCYKKLSLAALKKHFCIAKTIKEEKDNEIQQLQNEISSLIEEIKKLKKENEELKRLAYFNEGKLYYGDKSYDYLMQLVL